MKFFTNTIITYLENEKVENFTWSVADFKSGRWSEELGFSFKGGKDGIEEKPTEDGPSPKTEKLGLIWAQKPKRWA